MFKSGCRALVVGLLGISICTACGQSQDERQVTSQALLFELEQLIPMQSGLYVRTAILGEGESAREYRIVLKNTSSLVSAQKQDERLEAVKKQVPVLASGYFCNGSILNSLAERILSSDGSIKLVVTDSQGEEFSAQEIDSRYCRAHPSAAASEVRNSIREDGKFTRRYVEKFLLPSMKLQLPNTVSSEFEAFSVDIGRGSSIIFTLKYTPKAKNVSEELATDVAGSKLEELYGQACRNTDTKELISRLDSFTWQVEWNGKIITKAVASPNCR